MVVTLTSLRAYLRAKDTRINAQTDDQINSMIRYGIHNLAHQMLCFNTSNLIPLNIFTTPLDIFYPVEPNVINYYYYEIVDAYGNKAYGDSISIRNLSDNTIEVKIKDGTDVSNLYLDVRYFYAPEMIEEESLDISAEVYHFMKHALQVVMWGSLKDYEKEQYHQKVWDTHAKTTTLTYPNDMSFDSMKGGYE